MMDISDKFNVAIDEAEHEYDELVELTSSVEIMSDHKLYNFYLSKLKQIEPIAKLVKELKSNRRDYDVAIELQGQYSEDFQLDANEFKEKQERLIVQIKELLANKKKMENERVSIEITSKEDFEICEMLVNIFEIYSKTNGYNFEKAGKESDVELIISGEAVYDKLKLFAGKVKKVFKGVETHCLVVVLKQEDDSIEIDEKDLVIQTSKSSGAGGQHINKTESAVRVIHVPTGIYSECQDERSQTKNKEKAIASLLKKITQNKQEIAKKQEKSQRNELKNKIFSSTPNIIFDFDENKVILTANKLEYKLKDILNGDIGLIINDNA